MALERALYSLDGHPDGGALILTRLHEEYLHLRRQSKYDGRYNTEAIKLVRSAQGTTFLSRSDTCNLVEILWHARGKAMAEIRKSAGGKPSVER